MPPILKDRWEIEIMRQAGAIVAGTLALVREHVRPGISTGELDAMAEEYIRDHDALPTFKGYKVGSKTYHASLCTSINEEVVHGIPSRSRILREGDILSVDCGATYKNYVGDAAITVPVGRISPEAARILEATRGALDAGIAAALPGARIRDIAAAVQGYAEARGYNLVKSYCGHGVGQKLHEEPQIPNYVTDAYESIRLKLKPGLVIAIEPMLTEGTDDVEELPDRWTVVTADRKLSAHFEHTIALTGEGNEILTLPLPDKA